MARILVVEDESTIREEVMDWLQFEGYEIDGAANGRLALARIYQACPDLIISDIAMPEMGGYELLLEVRSEPQLLHVPFIFLTAATERADIRHGMAAGADDYLTKPFTHQELLNSVRTRLDKQAQFDTQVQANFDAMSAALNEEREKQLLKSRLMAMFSHDFRNPLASILSSSNMIRNYEDRLSPERKRQHLDRIDGAVHVLLQMLDEMMMIAEMEGNYLQYTPQPVDVVLLVADLVDELRVIDQNAHTLTFVGESLGMVEADPKLLRHILTNLGSNAMKYSSDNTEIRFSVAATDQHIIFTVEDQGRGIPADSVSLLFDPYFRANNVDGIKGTGLGLSIVKYCVDHHSGHIDVESVLDKGSRFIVTIPKITLGG